MANFVLAIDQDKARCDRFMADLSPHLSPISGLLIAHRQLGSCQISWAANPKAPVSTVLHGNLAIVLGSAIAQKAISAAQLNQDWAAPAASCPIYDGFYAAIRYEPSSGLKVGSDLLGLFPIYYTLCHTSFAGSVQTVLLVGSSPALFRHHPLFEPRLSPQGLTGLLMTNGLVNGQTLWQKVYRLSPRHLLTWGFQQGLVEIEQYALPQPDTSGATFSRLSFAEQVDQLDYTIDRAFQRQMTAPTADASANPSSDGILFSGGLDSRMLAGFLSRQQQVPMAITLGDSGDLEMACARSVVRHLGWSHCASRSDPAQAVKYATTVANDEHLANGFNGVDYWALHDTLYGQTDRQKDVHPPALPQRIITGHIIEAPVGAKVGGLLPADSSFDSCFLRTNRWGLSLTTLGQLLRPEIFGEAIPETVSAIAHTYRTAARSEFHRDLYFDLSHRQRLHVGATAWRLSFSAWPILPVLDREILSIPAHYPVKTLLFRRAQKALVTQKFPQLAALPLDSNGFETTPLLQSDRYKQLAPLIELQRKWRRLRFKLGRDPRYFYRTYSLNTPFWQAIRRAAEPQRETLYSLFEPEVLDSVLPKPGRPIELKPDPIPAASGLKLLLGLMIWSKKNL
ncbi:MAG: asparagine synthase-related protein [Cyanobacteria bacterium J06623_5]